MLVYNINNGLLVLLVFAANFVQEETIGNLNIPAALDYRVKTNLDGLQPRVS